MKVPKELLDKVESAHNLLLEDENIKVIPLAEVELYFQNARAEQMQINWDKIELECRKAGLIIELKSYQGDVNLGNDTRGTQYVAMRGVIDLIKKESRPKP